MGLSTKLSDIKGVGPKTAELFANSGLDTVRDLLEYFPRRYEDFSHAEKISDLSPGQVVVRGKIDSVNTRFVRRNMRITTATISDDSGSISAVWFNQNFREKNLKSFVGTNQEFLFSGDFKLGANRYTLSNPAVEKIDIKQNFFAKDFVDTGADSSEKITPIYPQRSGLKSSVIRKVLRELKPLITMLPESLPQEILSKEKLISRSDAVNEIHFPTNNKDLELAKKRLSFDELFGLILAARMNKNSNQKLKGFDMEFDVEKFRRIISSLPFKLTDAQRKALWEIISDFTNKQTFANSTPMNRLLQGDVGSGKTIVAGLAGFVAAQNNLQVALMAPTEILATQHAKTLSNLLEPFGVNVALLTGSIKKDARKNLLNALKNGEINILVGTHALFQPSVKFANLGFVIIDEQHRFGVKQRQDLLSKTRDEMHLPHLLAMTATPIPRSLQLTVFGDLDVSILDQMPGGRKPIKTKIVNPLSRTQMNALIKKELASGRQAYFIAPNIEAGIGDKENVAQLAKKVMKEFAKSSEKKDIKVGILHGKMDSESKEKIMCDFAENKLQILVSTTVVEVGVDVPNASIIVIENADNFGLAQLHQLRGRVGRGDVQSYCFLVQTDEKAPTRRLREIENSVDGFYLAEIDLELRGAGEIYGRAQHGAIDLKIANLADTKLIKHASNAADEFISRNISIENYPELNHEIHKYQRLTTLN